MEASGAAEIPGFPRYLGFYSSCPKGKPAKIAGAVNIGIFGGNMGGRFRHDSLVKEFSDERGKGYYSGLRFFFEDPDRASDQGVP